MSLPVVAAATTAVEDHFPSRAPHCNYLAGMEHPRTVISSLKDKRLEAIPEWMGV